MKRLTLFSLLGLLTALLLSGCAGAATPAAPADAAAAGAAGERDFYGPYPPADISLLATTGRPQLLNFYADW